MTSFYDVAIVGAGAFGSSATYHLSKTGKKILVFDRFVPPHSMGSSHGQSRIIREAYFESPVYVPLVQQAYILWDQLEKESGKKLFLKTGGLMLGAQNSKVVRGAALSAETYNLPYELLDSHEIANRFPGFRPTKETVGVYEKNAGILFPETCIKTNLELAKNSNVDFCFDEVVLHINTNDNEVEVTTSKAKYRAAKLIISAGAWINDLLPGLHLPLSVARQVLFWFKCNNEDASKFLPQNFPVYLWQCLPDQIFYGFPDLGDGIKIAIHYNGEPTTASTIKREVDEDEINEMTSLIKQYLNVAATFSHYAVCMYTNTPDEDFIIDFHPQHQNIIIASPCSGHGFKFSSAIGKLLCDMALDKQPGFDISVFAIRRFI
jgi:sarcosine oxidase